MTHETDTLGDRQAESAVSAYIHPDDHIFRFVSHASPDRSKAVREYIRGGADAANWLKKMIATFRPVDQPFSLLEFAAGYGRVTRHLPLVLPAARIVASDIHPSAVECLGQFGVTPHQSSSTPETLAVAEKFDVIFALSFFTHMPKSSWSRWLRALVGSLKPDGCLIFTTHGVPGMKIMGDAHGCVLTWDDEGFWFAPMSEQSDIDTAEYGSTGTSFNYVHKQIEACGAALFQFQERGAGYQDVYIVRKAGAIDQVEATQRPARTAVPRRGVPRIVQDPNDCIFYHTMELPGLGLVEGQWDLRGSEHDCLGNVPLSGKSVLEVGPASGYLSFWMERQGACVTSFDLDETEHWDLVPFAGEDAQRIHVERGDLIRKVNNAWWYTHKAVGATAQCFYGTAYDVDASLGMFDVVTINSVLLHLRDPLLAVERAAARSRSKIVITEVSERQFAPDLTPQGALSMQLIPRAAPRGPMDAWWNIPSTLLAEFLQILGFEQIEIKNFDAKFQDGYMWQLYTIVGTRPAG